jgi:uncharacterized protein (UPF0254 family)
MADRLSLNLGDSATASVGRGGIAVSSGSGTARHRPGYGRSADLLHRRANSAPAALSNHGEK